jgi:hypothetical protein
MSDLHCAARLLVGRAGSAAGLAGRVAGERVAGVRAARMPTARRTAHELAELVDAPCEDLPEGTLRQAFEELADLHRGETLVVVAGEDWPTELGAVPDGTALVPVEVDADGWRVGPPVPAAPD